MKRLVKSPMKRQMKNLLMMAALAAAALSAVSLTVTGCSGGGETTVTQDWRAYEEMSGQLTAMKVPEEFWEPHRQLISGFNKWQSTFEVYRTGFRDNNKADLDKAREYDNQAVIEVNQAVNEISQVE